MLRAPHACCAQIASPSCLQVSSPCVMAVCARGPATSSTCSSVRTSQAQPSHRCCSRHTASFSGCAPTSAQRCCRALVASTTERLLERAASKPGQCPGKEPICAAMVGAATPLCAPGRTTGALQAHKRGCSWCQRQPGRSLDKSLCPAGRDGQRRALTPHCVKCLLRRSQGAGSRTMPSAQKTACTCAARTTAPSWSCPSQPWRCCAPCRRSQGGSMRTAWLSSDRGASGCCCTCTARFAAQLELCRLQVCSS